LLQKKKENIIIKEIYSPLLKLEKNNKYSNNATEKDSKFNKIEKKKNFVF
jgi:hypothetical protein